VASLMDVQGYLAGFPLHQGHLSFQPTTAAGAVF
jgi:hypothetical protein